MILYNHRARRDCLTRSPCPNVTAIATPGMYADAHGSRHGLRQIECAPPYEVPTFLAASERRSSFGKVVFGLGADLHTVMPQLMSRPNSVIHMLVHERTGYIAQGNFLAVHRRVVCRHNEVVEVSESRIGALCTEASDPCYVRCGSSTKFLACIRCYPMPVQRGYLPNL